jgi:hypothetical protein
MSTLAFTGRTDELLKLIDMWQLATTKNEPEIITLIGDSGSGKTRLVQEFYHYIARHQQWNPAEFNYWPDAFQTPQTQLHVNPDFTNHTPKGPPLFFWSGLRWSDPMQRNTVPDAALVLLRHQLITFAQRSTELQPTWKRTLQELLHNTKSQFTWQSAIGLVADSLFPLGGVITSVLIPTMSTLRKDQVVPQLPELILTLFRAWFQQSSPLPIVLWLDDAQWMDAEARVFFAELATMAQQHKWAILFVATYWPAEWNHTTAQEIFLKKFPVIHLSKPPVAQLATIITSQFPGLKTEQIQLLIEKTDGNYLTLVENIGELHAGAEEYFHAGDTKNALLDEAIMVIHQWESTRAKRAAQRFAAFDRAIQNVLARAARIGIGTRFCINVLIRFAQLQNIRDINTLIDACITPLAVIHTDTPYFYEFRERDYVTVAYKIFDNRLRTREEAQLLVALDEELMIVIDALYRQRMTPMTANQDAIIDYHPNDIILFAQLAMQRIPMTHDTYFHALVVLLDCHMQHYQWSAIRAIHQQLSTPSWLTWIQQIHTIKPFEIIATAFWMSGHIDTAGKIYVCLRDYFVCLHPTTISTSNIDAIANIYTEVINYSGWNGNSQVGVHDCESMLEFLHTHHTCFSDQTRYIYYQALTHTNLFYFMNSLNSAHRNSSIEQALHYARMLVQQHPTILHQQLLRRALMYTGWLDDMLNEPIYQEVLHISEYIYANTSHPDDLEDLIIAHEYITRIRIHQKQYAEAHQSCQVHTDLAHTLVSQRQSPDDYKRLEMAYRYAAQIAEQTSQPRQALALWGEALTIAQHIIEQRQAVFDIHDIAVINWHIGLLHKDLRSFTDAILHLSDATAMYARVLAIECRLGFLNRYIQCVVMLGSCYHQVGHYSAMMTMLPQCIDTCQSHMPHIQNQLATLTPRVVEIHLWLIYAAAVTKQETLAHTEQQRLISLLQWLSQQTVDISPFQQHIDQFMVTYPHSS